MPSAAGASGIRWLGLVLALWLAGCASYTEETREIRRSFVAGDYKQALSKLEESSLKDEDNNRLLFKLERAMILDRMGDGERARALLIEADKLVDQLYTTSVSNTAATFIVNEAASDYSGEDYEKVAIHTQMALSFIGDGKLEQARVEAKKINNKLAEINQQYDEKKNRYAEDAFALYLSGLIYEVRGELDDALIDYWRAYQLYDGDYRDFVRGGEPDGLVRALYRLLVKRNRSDRAAKVKQAHPKIAAQAEADLKDDNWGEVVVVHEVGHIATKSTEEVVVPFGKQIVRFSFPVIRKRQITYHGETGFVDRSGGGAFYAADNVQDMDDIARLSLEDRRGRLIAKQMTRLLAKGQLTEQAYKNFGPIGGIAANIYSAVSETADTRSWTLLPEAYFVSRARIKPGKHTIEIKTGGRLQEIKTIDIKKGQIVILRGVG
jgi:hypothetical protein